MKFKKKKTLKFYVGVRHYLKSEQFLNECTTLFIFVPNKRMIYLDENVYLILQSFKAQSISTLFHKYKLWLILCIVHQVYYTWWLYF